METAIKTYTTLELEPILHCDKRVLDRKCREGIIPAFKVGRSWVIEENNLQDFIRKTRGEVRK